MIAYLIFGFGNHREILPFSRQSQICLTIIFLFEEKMLTNPDFKDLLKLFEKHKIRYLIVGGYAVMKYTEPRFTKDLDVLIATDEKTAAAVFSALKEFGAPLENLSIDDFAHKGFFYQMGRPPLRVDIMMSIPGIEFDEAWKNREAVQIDDLKIRFISRSDLIQAKEASGRPQDKIDLERLKIAEQLDSPNKP